MSSASDHSEPQKRGKHFGESAVSCVKRALWNAWYVAERIASTKWLRSVIFSEIVVNILIMKLLIFEAQ